MSTCATLGLVLGILSIFILTALFGPAAIVLGTIGGSAGYARGWVGMGLGTFSTGLMVVLIIAALA